MAIMSTLKRIILMQLLLKQLLRAVLVMRELEQALPELLTPNLAMRQIATL